MTIQRDEPTHPQAANEPGIIEHPGGESHDDDRDDSPGEQETPGGNPQRDGIIEHPLDDDNTVEEGAGQGSPQP